jgi:hypothetical protein
VAELKEQVRALYKEQGPRVPEHSATAVYEAMQHPGREMMVSSGLRLGMFAFVLYDLAGKSTPMEQYSPMLLVETRNVKTKVYLWGLSLNFIPVSIRVVFMDQLLARFGHVLEANAAKRTLAKEGPLPGLSFDVVYTMLQAIGYEYALRQLDMSLINKVYEVSFGFLDRFLTMDTRRFTGVDEGRLLEIWVKKITEQEERHRKMLLLLYNDYDKMADTINKSIVSALDTAKNLERTASNMRQMGL